ncbi:MAG: diadenylate cyclase CdaA [Lachnospiraceae bacterium]|nr:diadenylate cyclase CdaA [Lachnospiraceae bacterium]
MTEVSNFFSNLTGWYMPKIGISDLVEICIIAVLLYYVLVWIKDTRAWMLLRGLLVLGAFTVVVIIFQLETIFWLEKSILSVGIVALVVIFQPELRRALEQLGRQQIFLSLFNFDEDKNNPQRFSEFTLNEIVKACTELGHEKTGALIVVEQLVNLSEYEKTGIPLDALVSSQLLMNIFEHNTPLHDGAIILRGDRIVAATCYLPLSDNRSISKELGTRHRAGIGISEVSDSLTVIVSEETGKISIAFGGDLIRNLDSDSLREKLGAIQKTKIDSKSFKLWKGKEKKKR